MIIPVAAGVPKTETGTERAGLGSPPKKEMIYVVAVLRIAGYTEKRPFLGETVIQVTRNPREAVETARSVEDLGYEFCPNEGGASVYCLEVGKQYDKALFDLTDGSKRPINYPVVLRRYKTNTGWDEVWFNEMTKFIMGLQ